MYYFSREKESEFVLSPPPIRTVERRAGPTARVAYRVKDVVKEIRARKRNRPATYNTGRAILRRAQTTEVVINELCL